MCSTGHTQYNPSSSFLGIEPYELDMKFQSDHFIAPNEVAPNKLIPIIRKAPPGAYVSVGTERGFISAAMNPQTEFLLLVDINPNVILWNRINIGLLRAARTRKEYLALRLKSSRKAWLYRAQDTTLDRDVIEILTSRKLWEFWRKLVSSDTFSLFHMNPKLRIFSGRKGEFKDANYLYYQEQFDRIQALAKSNRIEAHQVDLFDTQAIEMILDKLKARKIPVSVWDESNVDEYRRTDYGTQGLHRVIQTVLPYGTSGSVFVTTSWNNLVQSNYHYWNYFGYTFRYLAATTNYWKGRNILIDIQAFSSCASFFVF